MNNVDNVWVPNKEEKEIFLNRIIETRNGNQDFFEKHFTYIAAGSIGILLTMFNNVLSLNFRYSYLISISLFTFSLLLNLYSYIRAINFADENIDELERGGLHKVRFEKGRGVLKSINYFSLFLMILGSLFLMRFVLMNLNKI